MGAPFFVPSSFAWADSAGQAFRSQSSPAVRWPYSAAAWKGCPRFGGQRMVAPCQWQGDFTPIHPSSSTLPWLPLAGIWSSRNPFKIQDMCLRCVSACEAGEGLGTGLLHTGPIVTTILSLGSIIAPRALSVSDVK